MDSNDENGKKSFPAVNLELVFIHEILSDSNQQGAQIKRYLLTRQIFDEVDEMHKKGAVVCSTIICWCPLCKYDFFTSLSVTFLCKKLCFFPKNLPQIIWLQWQIGHSVEILMPVTFK